MWQVMLVIMALTHNHSYAIIRVVEGGGPNTGASLLFLRVGANTMSQQIIDAIEQRQLKASLPEFRVGDTVRVGVRVVEGSRERVQDFEGVVIRRRSGGINANFTVRRIASHGVGVERTFLVHAPRVEAISVVRRGKVRRARLFYLRGLTGKAARIKERRD